MTTDELLARLAAHYGKPWTAGDGDTAQVWADWDAALRSISPAMAESALKRLPPQVIGAWGFRALAVMSPASRAVTGLTAERRSGLDGLRDAQRAVSRDPLAWAKRLREREQSGERLTPFIASLWRDVLKGQ